MKKSADPVFSNAVTPFRSPATLSFLASAWLLAFLISGCKPTGASTASSSAAKAASEAGREARSGGKHPVTVRPGPSTPVVFAEAKTPDGKPVAVSCSTCHATRPPQRETASGAALRDFHRGLTLNHGNLSCLSCHNAANYDTLRLADGTALEYPDTIRLCAQCHGPQYRDYNKGVHGGMNGYWDLTRGPRTRNTCVDCHDPHAPAFPKVSPVFPPRDRGVRASSDSKPSH